MPRLLTGEELARFRDEGYLVVDGLFAESDLQPVIDEISGEIDVRANELVAAGKLSRTFCEADFEHRLALISAETDEVALSLWNGALAGPGIFHLLCHPALLDIAEQICGPELIASSVYRIRPKIPDYDYGAVPWHQDSGYTEPFCDRFLMLTVWLPLVDATVDRGCMWVVPGSHREGKVVKHQIDSAHRYLEIPEGDLPEGEAIPVPMRKGDVLLLTNLTAHASFENRSDVVRWSMDLRYQSAALPTNAAVTRLPGELSAGDTVPPACFPPEADFLVRSRLRPDEVVTETAVFRAIRENHLALPVSNRWG